MHRTLTFWDVMDRAGFVRDGNPGKGMITSKLQHGADNIAGRYAFLFDRGRFPVAIEGVFKSGAAPVLVFVDGTAAAPDEATAVEWHRMAWNVGIAPLLWINFPDRVLILDSYRRPSGRLRDVVLAEFATSNAAGVSDLVTACGRLAFETGAFWSSSFVRQIDRHHRVDAVLLRELTAVERALTGTGLSPLLAQKLIGRTIFSQYLIDREVLKPEHLQRLFGPSRLSDTLRSVETAADLFDWLRETFNGDLFPPDVEDERVCVRAEHLARLADFLDGHEADTGQLSVFPFRFHFIPVELISSIYEQFAHSVAGADAAAQGLHYTPVNLVDLALDQVMEDVGGTATVLDPACGSGVFLVEAMRRLVWLRTRDEANSRELVRDVLRNQIFGVDINAGALQVAAFSLYLATLELDPDLHSGDLGWLRFDNLIGRNLLHGSFFEAEALEGRHFDIVVGNPPWTYTGGATENEGRSTQNRVAKPSRSPDWAFMWQARRHAAPKGRMALLMKATPFFSKEKGATEARRMLFATFRDVRLINFSQIRNEGLFPSLISRPEGKRKANAGPALLFCGTVGIPRDDDTVETANVLWNRHYRRNGVLDVSPDDFHQSCVTTVSADPVLLKAAVFGNEREYEVMAALQTSPSLTRLGVWCEAHGVRMEQGLQVGGGARGDARDLLGLPFLDASTYRPVRVPPRRLHTFALEHAHRPRERETYRAPLVICPEASFAGALQRGRYSAAVLSEDTVFTDSFVGVSFAGHDPLLADVLALILNSKTVAFLLALGGSNTGLKQPKIEKVDLEALSLPDLSALSPPERARLSGIYRKLDDRPSSAVLDIGDAAVMDLYGLDSHDQRLIEDALTRTRPILLDSREERELEVRGVTPRLLHEYGCEIAHWLDTALRQVSSARTVVTRGVRVAPDVVALRLDVQDGPVRPLEEFRIAEPDLFEIALIADAADPFLAKFRTGRSMRVYVDRAIYIVKPDQRRHWSSSNAQVDIRRVLDDFRSKRVKAITVENLVPIAKREAILRLH